MKFSCSNPGKIQETFQRQGLKKECLSPSSLYLSLTFHLSRSFKTATLMVAGATPLWPDSWAAPTHAEPATHRESAVLQVRVPEKPPIIQSPFCQLLRAFPAPGRRGPCPHGAYSLMRRIPTTQVLVSTSQSAFW